jgi:hypothetical protein
MGGKCCSYVCATLSTWCLPGRYVESRIQHRFRRICLPCSAGPIKACRARAMKRAYPVTPNHPSLLYVIVGNRFLRVLAPCPCSFGDVITCPALHWRRLSYPGHSVHVSSTCAHYIPAQPWHTYIQTRRQHTHPRKRIVRIIPLRQDITRVPKM